MRSENSVNTTTEPELSWLQRIKGELISHFTRSVKSRKAELTAILLLNPGCVHSDPENGLYIYEEPDHSEKNGTANKNCFTGRHKKYNIKDNLNLTKDPKDLYRDQESKRAFLRGAFLAAGSFTDPQKRYQFEIITEHLWQAEELKKLMADFGIHARIMERRERFVVYLKDGSAIVDILNVIGAHKALMEFENVRILKEMRESVNRQVNCETANIQKTIAASMKQLDDIEFIRQTIGFDQLDENLKEICMVRLNHPDIGLSELGALMTPPLGKSGVNHRFRRLSELAERIRQQQSEL